MRKCNGCKRTIEDTESCWRDHAGKYWCNQCCEAMKGKHD